MNEEEIPIPEEGRSQMTPDVIRRTIAPLESSWMDIFIKWQRAQYSHTIDGLQDYLEKHYNPPTPLKH